MFTFNRGFIAGAALLAILAAPPGAIAQSAIAEQIDAAHTGVVTMQQPLKLPLTKLWSATLSGTVSFPVIADGRVIVTVDSMHGEWPSIVAFDKRTGQQLWSTTVNGTVGLTYGQGMVFSVYQQGRLYALDAATGNLVWSVQLPAQSYFTGVPTYYKGGVFLGGAGSGGTVYAVDAATGAVRWTSEVMNGDASSPAVSDEGVFVTYICGNTYAFNPANGHPLWSQRGNCEGGGGSTPSLLPGKALFTRDPIAGNLVMQPASGQVVAKFASDTLPALSSSKAFTVSRGALTAWDLGTRKAVWTFNGTGRNLTSSPLVVDGWVVAGAADGTLSLLDTQTGAVKWSTNVGAPIPQYSEGYGSPQGALSAGEGVIGVPAGNLLTVYGN